MLIASTMWIIVIILGLSDFKTESTRWVMGLTFFAGIAGISVFWGSNAPVIIKNLATLGYAYEVYRIIGVILSALFHYFMPYCALMFGLSYSGTIPVKYQKIAAILLLTPLAITFFFFPTYEYYFNNKHQYMILYRFISTWAVPYLLTSCALQIYSYVKEDTPFIKKQRLIFCIIAVPGIAITSMTSFLLSGFPIDKPWKYNTFIILYVFILFAYSLIRYGVLGIKLRIEKQNLSNMMSVLNGM
jgi:hypothetical protein